MSDYMHQYQILFAFNCCYLIFGQQLYSFIMMRSRAQYGFKNIVFMSKITRLDDTVAL